MEKSSCGAQPQQEQLIAEHRQKAQILNQRLWEAEQQHLKSEEKERLGKEEDDGHLQSIYAVQKERLHLNQQLNALTQYMHLLQGNPTDFHTHGHQLCSHISALTRGSRENQSSRAEDQAMAEKAFQEMCDLLANLQQEVARANGEKLWQEKSAQVKPQE